VIEVCGPEPASASAATDVRSSETVAVTVGQRRVLEALCRPLLEGEHAAASNREIATALVLSAETVKSTISALLERFGLTGVPPHQKRAALAARGVAMLRDA
jgi:DNA-binding NarL/FixJ family response regulator